MDQETFEHFMTELGQAARANNNTLAASVVVVAAKRMKEDGLQMAQLYVFRMLKQIGQVAEWAEVQRLKDHLPTYAELEDTALEGK